jgi:hypothetical protein
MIQLQAADVDALRCEFVHSIYSYLLCRRYALKCDLDTPTQNFLNYKLAAQSCTLDEDSNCQLVNAVKPTRVVSCDINIPCSAQADVNLRIRDTGHVYTPTIINEDFDTQAPLYTAQADIALVPNSINQNATVTVGIVDESLNIIDQTTFNTGSAKVGMSVVSSSAYSMQALTTFAIDGVSTVPNGYIKTIRLYYTNSIGQYIPGQYVDINVSPVDSPYMACGTCTPVTFSDLFFASPN